MILCYPIIWFVRYRLTKEWKECRNLTAIARILKGACSTSLAATVHTQSKEHVSFKITPASTPLVNLNHR